MATRPAPRRNSGVPVLLLAGLAIASSVLPAAAQDPPRDPQDQPTSDMPTLAGTGLGLAAGIAFGFFYSAIEHPGLPHADLPEEVEYVPLFAIAGAVLGTLLAARSPDVIEGVNVTMVPHVGRPDTAPRRTVARWQLAVSFRH